MTVQVDYSQFKLYKKEAIVVNEQTSSEGLQWLTGSEGEKIWMGHYIVSPTTASKAQHHGNADTVHYIYDGEATFYYGEDYKEEAALLTGDFIYLPPYEPYKVKNNSEATTTIVTTMAPKYSVVALADDEKVAEQGASNLVVQVVRASELDDSTKQTDNLPRKTAIQAPNLWIGRVSGAPRKDSGAHHHDAAETAGFIVKGKTRILHGENYEAYEDLHTGDFLRVPPYVPHIERNLSDTETIEFLTARNPENFVVNLNDKAK